MGVKKELETGSTVEAWNYDALIYKGQSIGIFDRASGNTKAMVSVESVDLGEEGIVKRILIDRELAEKHGFQIQFK